MNEHDVDLQEAVRTDYCIRLFMYALVFWLRR